MTTMLKVMIAGIGGASLGTELLKCLKLAGRYEVYGCDISPSAYGLYDNDFAQTFLVGSNDYVENVLQICCDVGAEWLLPGGEIPLNLLSSKGSLLEKAGVHLVANSNEVYSILSDKNSAFTKLSGMGVPVPQSIIVRSSSDLDKIKMPCIVKPSANSGGSVNVFYAITIDEAIAYSEIISRAGNQPIAQEYVSADEGEFTIGVLSLPNSRLVGSIALLRDFGSKLSVAYRGNGGIISSGYSQGQIGLYPKFCRQAEAIAAKLGSCGPLNIQGRVRQGVLLPFEINPRFSASTYLRAMAGFNEVDMLIGHLAFNEEPVPPIIRSGWYLRSLTETYVTAGDLK